MDQACAVGYLIGLGALTLLLLAPALSVGHLRAPSYLRTLWVFALFLSVAEWLSFDLAIWILALFSIASLREYFSLVDIRLQDRWAILAAYLSVPFMTWLIQANWYGFFIVSIPVYVFLLVPFLVVLGGDTKGCVLSIGAIDFGLFFYVFCIGHIGYTAFFSTGLAATLVLGVALSDLAARLFGRCRGLRLCPVIAYLTSAPVVVALFLLLNARDELPSPQAVVAGLLLPFLVQVGTFTMTAVEIDLGIDPEHLEPGRGRLIDATRSYLFTAPVVFHYLRWSADVIP